MCIIIKKAFHLAIKLLRENGYEKIVALFLVFSLMFLVIACGSKDVEVKLPISMLVEEGEDFDFKSISSQAKDNGIKVVNIIVDFY